MHHHTETRIAVLCARLTECYQRTRALDAVGDVRGAADWRSAGVAAGTELRQLRDASDASEGE